MELDYSLTNVLILLGGIQGLIFSLILLSKRKRQAQLFLGIFILAITYNAFETFTALSGLSKSILFFDFFSYTVVFLTGPSLYFYIQSILFPEKIIARSVILKHLILPIFQGAINVILLSIYLLAISQVISFEVDLIGLYQIFDTYSQPLSILVFATYLGMSIKLYVKSSAEEGELISSSANQKTTLKFTKILLIILSGLAVLWIVAWTLASYSTINVQLVYYPLEITLVFFIYWSFFVINNKLQFLNEEQKQTNQLQISKSDATKIMSQLKRLMEEDQLYLSPKITREIVATKAEVSPKHISTILNQFHKQNFNDFVNNYRIEAVKSHLRSDKLKTNTITGIALDSGFNSQATFQRVFKKSVGVSPKEYAAQYAEKALK
ncbi:helix-turn-helix domain-containing protein [Roseivirga misakiensis]|uniref:HTH araC/xylS-type domain-containing protein n=1 Tax=Roseivirga misakiensis TaxID=1563681 RepID=A0A1E5SL11_9BACT|nr:AraC family transcriptional regulator [Roseivirga misakiensis]OEJ99815.1 hypothetical protein BFP71_09685 [Roseivirga misakiensis]